MSRVAIAGGGIAGLAAAWECHKLGLDWQLYEASARLGGTLATTCIDTGNGRYVLEDGPDGWVTEKPWARELAVELGLGDELLPCNEARRRTLILIDGKLQLMPARMRMMVPEDLAALESSPLFSDSARASYAAELANAAQLRDTAPQQDESVASFVLRHFGQEVLEKIGAPLLSGVFGGDVRKLSVRAVMPSFVTMEREHGSLILALQIRAGERGARPLQPTFTTLRDGMGSLVEAIAAKLPAERVHLNSPLLSLQRQGKLWCVRTANPTIVTGTGKSKRHFQHVILATSADATRSLLGARHPELTALLPTDASSAVLVTFAWPAETAATIALPEGFGFLVPQQGGQTKPSLLACTFADRKYPQRAPDGAKVLRAFFGGASADALAAQSAEYIAKAAFSQLTSILGPLPAADATLTTVRRWPRSLPQYEVGHLDRMAQLDERLAQLPGLTLLGNAYRGVGVPDLIRDAREAVRKLIAKH